MRKATDTDACIAKQWYAETATYLRLMAHRVGLPPDNVILAAALLSPRTRWDVVLMNLEAWLQDFTAPMPGFNTNKTAARWAVIQGLNVLPYTGRKVRSFAMALLGDHDAVVLDVWMLKAAFGRADMPLSKGLYNELAEEIRYLSKTTNGAWSPRDLQALIWWAIRRRGTPTGFAGLDPITWKTS